MLNLARLKFKPIDICRENNLSWQANANIHLQAKRRGSAMKYANTISQENKALTLIFLYHHIHNNLKIEYLTKEDPLCLRVALK